MHRPCFDPPWSNQSMIVRKWTCDKFREMKVKDIFDLEFEALFKKSDSVSKLSFQSIFEKIFVAFGQ